MSVTVVVKAPSNFIAGPSTKTVAVPNGTDFCIEDGALWVNSADAVVQVFAPNSWESGAVDTEEPKVTGGTIDSQAAAGVTLRIDGEGSIRKMTTASTPIPSKPIVFSRLGVIEVRWDGFDNEGNLMPEGFGHVAVYGTANDTEVLARFEVPGIYTFAATDYGKEYRFFLRTVSISTGAVSVSSESASATCKPLVNIGDAKINIKAASITGLGEVVAQAVADALAAREVEKVGQFPEAEVGEMISDPQPTIVINNFVADPNQFDGKVTSRSLDLAAKLDGLS